MDLDRPETRWDFTLPHEEAEAADRLAAEWESSLRPFDNFECDLLRKIGVHSVRITRCQHHERALRTLHATRARLRWDEDRRTAAEATASRLPKAPSLVVAKLAATKQGCDWLIDRWEGLGRLLASDQNWDKSQESLAMDLLGVAPEFRRGPTPLDGDLDARRGLVRAEVDRLHALNARAMIEMDAAEREMAVQGFGPDHDGQLAEVRRFERSCTRGLEWSRNQLRSYRTSPIRSGMGTLTGTATGTGTGRFAPPPMPTPPPPASRSGAEDREEQQFRAERQRAALQAMPAPVAPPETLDLTAAVPAAVPETEPAATAEPSQDAPLTPLESLRIVMGRPEILEMSPADRARALIRGLGSPPGGRRA